MILTLVLAVTQTITSANEIWPWLEIGDIVYVADFGDIAILAFGGPHPGNNFQLHISGLGGNLVNEGKISG